MISLAEGPHGIYPHTTELVVSYSKNDSVITSRDGILRQRQAILMFGFFRADPGIVHIYINVVLTQLVNDVAVAAAGAT